MESIGRHTPDVFNKPDKDYLDFTAVPLIPVTCTMHFRTRILIGQAAAQSGYSIEDFILLSAWERTREVLSITQK
jgi:hypothetical protein